MQAAASKSGINGYTSAVPNRTDIAIIGAGAAGLMAAIWAGRTGRTACAGRADVCRPPSIVALDGARHLGAKILVAGGGRCNVTHDVVDESAYAGSSRHAIRKVLRRFDVQRTINFFRELGVELKREETGKLFPTTDKARTVLQALLNAARDAGVQIRHPWRVESIERQNDSRWPFRITGPAGELHARRVIIATGGRSLPKTGSDGHGYTLAQRLGHSLTPRIFPALVPLTLPKSHVLCQLSGVSTIATLAVHSSTGKRLIEFTDSLLCAHFGISGPAVLDISRYFTESRLNDAGTQLIVNWLPGQSLESVDAALRDLGKVSPGRWLREFSRTGEGAGNGEPGGLPDRLARALCEQAGVDPAAPGHLLTREKRRTLAATITRMQLPITGDRGYGHAEVTAGGVPLSELKLETMESRVCPGVHLVGEICDVDGRIGGYNFSMGMGQRLCCRDRSLPSRTIRGLSI